jgi:hypothetical protein
MTNVNARGSPAADALPRRFRARRDISAGELAMMGVNRARRLFGRLADRREERVASVREHGIAARRHSDPSYDGPATIPLVESDVAAMQGPLLHWTPTGKFPLQALGEAFHRDAIRAFAENDPRESALVFCTATLVHDAADSYHSDMIAVRIGDKRVAHLMRPDAQRFRQGLVASGIPLQPTTCDALISGGQVCDGRQHPFIIELDILLPGPSPTASAPTYQVPLRLSNVPEVSRNPDGEYSIRVPYMTLSAVQHCSEGCRLRLWTRDGIDTIQFLEPNSVAGSGRIATLAKHDVPELASDPDSVVATIRQIGVRSCVIDCSVRQREHSRAVPATAGGGERLAHA